MAGRKTDHVRAQALRASRRAEARYVRDLRDIMRKVHAGYVAALKLRHDVKAHDATLNGVDGRMVRYLREVVPPAFDRMAGEVNKANAKATKALVGVPLAGASVAPHVQRFRDQNIALMENAGRVYAKQVREVLEDPENFGIRVEDLAAKIQERGDVSESRAELIARDQTLKLNGQLNQVRQTNAGVERYTWSTSHDERVRPEHAELDGQVFDWSSPPEPGHPGEDFQCRCVALPVIEELEDV